MSEKLHNSQWKIRAKQLLDSLGSPEKDEAKIREILDCLNAFVYPVDLNSEDVEGLLKCFVKQIAPLQPDRRIRVAQLTYNLQTYQKEAGISSEVAVNLVKVFLSLLDSTNPPNELFYASASLLSPDVSFEDPGLFFKKDDTVMRMCMGHECSVEAQRAALHFVTAVCENCRELPKPTLEEALETVVKTLGLSTGGLLEKSDNSTLLQKLVLSKLRFLHSSLAHLCPLSSSSLPLLLSSLKANMMAGLSRDSPESLGCLRPPLALPRVPGAQNHPSPPSPAKTRTSQSTKGGHHEKKQTQRRARKEKSKNKDGDTRSSSGEDSTRLSSDGESSSGSSSGVAWQSRYQRGSDSNGGTSKSRFKGPRGKIGVSSSESDVSDSEASRMNAVMSKIRLEAHSSLALLFQLLDRQTSFSYWLSFLPDGPRPLHSPALLTTCVVKDPSPKCRGAAISVLCAMLDGSRPYLAAADDKPRPSQPFTPYSFTLGNVVRELHRVLLSALSVEPQQSNCTLLLKALCLLLTNTSYHQLTNSYLSQVTEVLEKMATHRDAHVQAAALSCCQVVVSISPTHRDVDAWLASGSDGAGSCTSLPTTPWLFQHCLSQLQMQGPLYVQTECLQVLGALAKHCFSHIQGCWGQLRDVYFSHLIAFPARLQPHLLKMVEELCRSLSSFLSANAAAASSFLSAEVVAFWEKLLGGPLTSLLQNYREQGQLASQACDTLSTIHPKTLALLKRPFCMLALSLPVELSGDESAPNSVKASAVRVLGVFVLFETLREDDSFFMDCHSAITQCLSSGNLTVRAQASWALANLADSFSPRPHLLTPHLALSLSSSILHGLRDVDKVRCNAVRAAGNLLKQLQESALPSGTKSVQELGVQLASCVNSGSMKSRWNACYACHGALSNPQFVSYSPASVAAIVSALCLAVHSCKNFKVRSNAAMALSGAAKCSVLSREQLTEVWAALWHALESSERQEDFSEFKHAATLKEQLCVAICNLLLAFFSAGAISESTLSQDLSEVSTRHFTYFLSRSLLMDGDSESDPAKQERRELIVATRDGLKALIDCGVGVGVSMLALWDVFANCFERSDRGM